MWSSRKFDAYFFVVTSNNFRERYIGADFYEYRNALWWRHDNGHTGVRLLMLY
jgi:hypothetical protein